MDFEYIDEGDIEAVKRGRKSEVPAELVEALKACPSGKAVALKRYAYDPMADDYKSYKARVSAQFRSAGKAAGLKVTCVWSPAGVPQVRVSPLSPSGKRK